MPTRWDFPEGTEVDIRIEIVINGTPFRGEIEDSRWLLDFLSGGYGSHRSQTVLRRPGVWCVHGIGGRATGELLLF